MNKKNLIVTLADKNYIKQAKQLFSSVYWNAGWKGDYMLLSYEIPEEELKWFLDKEILVKRCAPVSFTSHLKNTRHPELVFSKFYLFLSEFKKWKNIVYLDADIIVRGSLDELTKVKGFAAPNATSINLKKEFVHSKKKTYKKLIKDYPLTGSAFNSGIFAFNTNLIKEDTFPRLKELVKLYGELNIHSEEPTLNLLFYKKWEKLPWVYNLYPGYLLHACGIQHEKIKGIIIHFVACSKPWEKTSFFYDEWQDNLRKAESINLNSRPPAKKKWTEKEIKLNALYLNLKFAIYYIPRHIDRLLGRAGTFLKKHNPNIYFKLKRTTR